MTDTSVIEAEAARKFSGQVRSDVRDLARVIQAARETVPPLPVLLENLTVYLGALHHALGDLEEALGMRPEGE